MRSVFPMPVAGWIVVVSASMLLAGSTAIAQDLSGRWVYEESGQTIELEVRHDRANSRVTGNLSLFGQSSPFEGVIASGALVIQRLGDVRASADNGAMTARLQGKILMFTMTQPGQSPVTLPMVRRGDPTTALPTVAPSTGPASPPNGVFRAGAASDFAGEWQFSSPDSTSEEVVQLAVRGTDVNGEITALQHGYFSRRTTVKARLIVRGSLANGALQLRFWNAEGSPDDAKAATGQLRGEYFILRIGESETGYARPGRSLTQSAEGSAEAAALARAVTGRVYSRTSQAGGRGGAIVGGRLRFALCGNGTIEYDASDVGSSPDGGGSMGSTVTRRGTWGIVLYAGTPMVKARWNGTGTSYSLIAYFRIQPDASGRSAKLDGESLPVTDRC